MASKKGLTEAMKALSLGSTGLRRSASNLILPPKRTPLVTSPKVAHLDTSRLMATMNPHPLYPVTCSSDTDPSKIPLWRPDAEVPLTVHDFPSLEPLSQYWYSVDHINVPLRRDLLHLAVVWEGDMARQGTAHVKTSWEVHGSRRKLYQQKGTGRARVGWKQSPIRRGGGKVFGPRNKTVWKTRLNRKVYDQAWRIALSYRYRRGQLVVVRNGSLDLPVRADFLNLCARGIIPPEMEAGWWARYMTEMLQAQGFDARNGRTLFVAKNQSESLWTGLNKYAPEHGEAATIDDVDIKDLLTKGRVVMEKRILDQMLREHSSDLESQVAIHGWINKGPAIGRLAVG